MQMNQLKIKGNKQITATFNCRQGELWYFRLNNGFLRAFSQNEIESVDGKSPSEYPHYSDDYTSEPTFFDAFASKMPIKPIPNIKSNLISTREMVLTTIRPLASSQGFYSRLLQEIQEAESEGQDLTEFYEQFDDCKSILDVIFKLEC